MRLSTHNAARGLALLGVIVLGAGCPPVDSYPGDENFKRHPNNLLPDAVVFEETSQVGIGEVTGIALDQPIAYSHYTHVTTLGMECEYCHQAARKSIHAGVPSTQTCMNCHKYVKRDSAEIVKLTELYDAGTPTPWQKVHDLPDFVHFSHKRHVQTGVECTECHGQIGLQGQTVTWTEMNEDGTGVEMTGVKDVMIRETTMQMGWCLDCHASHPKISENYGDKADLRRAELKDCWTCHK